MNEKGFRSSADHTALIYCWRLIQSNVRLSETNHSCFCYLTLTCQADPSLDRCLWPSVGGGMTSVAVGAQVTEMGPGSRRCLSGSWRAACRCVSWVQGVTWWCWTGCGHLLHRGERRWWLKRGGQTGNKMTDVLEILFSRNAHRCLWQRTLHCMCQHSHHLKERDKFIQNPAVSLPNSFPTVTVLQQEHK